MNEQRGQTNNFQPEDGRLSAGESAAVEPKKGKRTIWIIAAIIFFMALIALGAFWYMNKYHPELISENNLGWLRPADKSEPAREEAALTSGDSGQETACALDTRECPDGARVSRIPPDCDFAECPMDELDDEAIASTESEDECVDEGEEITPATIIENGRTECCFGLKLILEEPDRFTRGFCLKCGDGICQAPEKYINCPEDCSEGVSMLNTEELNQDSDNDGLFDFEEAWHKTDPDNPDSDGDNYLDGSEVLGGFHPGGSGYLAVDFSTPEGTVIALENAKADCNLDLYADKIYFSDKFFNQMGMFMLYGRERISKEEIVEEMTKEYVKTLVYVNKIDHISITKKKYINEYLVGLYYKINYLPDDRGYTPAPKNEIIVLSRLDDGWLIDVGGIITEEFNNWFGDIEKVSGTAKDARRISDIKQIQTALELYYNDARRYPETVEMGGKIEYNGTTHMSAVPSNPESGGGECAEDFEYSYTVKENGESYILEYCLSGSTGGIPAGNNTASPMGLSERKDNTRPNYKQCYSDPGSKDARRVADIKQIQVALEPYYNDTEEYPTEMMPGQSLKSEETTYMQSLPNNPPPEIGICQDLKEYSYTQTEDGKSYELNYCLEEGTDIISAGYHTASPGGITD